jgi:hypothetical protein
LLQALALLRILRFCRLVMRFRIFNYSLLLLIFSLRILIAILPGIGVIGEAFLQLGKVRMTLLLALLMDKDIVYSSSLLGRVLIAL